MLAIKHGASALGLVSKMPSGPGVIDEVLIAEITSRIPPPIATFLLTSKQTAEEIIEAALFPVDTYIVPENIDPGSVILDKILSKYSAVFFPGLTPGINPPFLFMSSAICVGLIVIAV